MSVSLDDRERPVLEAFVALEKEDPEGAWNYFYVDVVRAAGSLDAAKQVCARLRQRKLLKGEGRGKFASFYPTDEGRAAVA